MSNRNTNGPPSSYSRASAFARAITDFQETDANYVDRFSKAISDLDETDGISSSYIDGYFDGYLGFPVACEDRAYADGHLDGVFAKDRDESKPWRSAQ